MNPEVPTPVAGVIPAAGASSRMASPKPLLDSGDGTFLDRTVRCLVTGGANPVVVVVSRLDDPIGVRARQTGAHVIETRYPAALGPLGSIRSALEWLTERTEGREEPAVGAILLLPVDMPLIRGETVGRLVAAHRADPDVPILAPRCGGRSGHPVLFAGPALEALGRDPDLPEGARSVVDRFRPRRMAVDVDDRGVLIDIDTIAEYRQHFPGPSRRRFQSR